MNHTQRYQPRFELGAIVATPGALENCSNVYMQRCLARHLTGDWCCIDAQDREANEYAATNGGERILSAYPINPAEPSEGFGVNMLWIITEADRSATTLLLPQEY